MALAGFMTGIFFMPSTLCIITLKILAVNVSVKPWAPVLSHQHIVILTDNKSIELALNSGKSRVPFTQACVRELCGLYAAHHDFKIYSTSYIADSQNIIADLGLSEPLGLSHK